MPRGRKSKYEPERVEKLLKAIRLGTTYKHACDYAGIHIDTFYEWQDKYPEFSDKIKEAEGEGIVSNFEIIKDAARDGNWQAAGWILERRHPDEYGRRVNDNRNTHSGPNGTPIQIQTYDYATAAASLAAGSSGDREGSGNE